MKASRLLTALGALGCLATAGCMSPIVQGQAKHIGRYNAEIQDETALTSQRGVGIGFGKDMYLPTDTALGTGYVPVTDNFTFITRPNGQREYTADTVFFLREDPTMKGFELTNVNVPINLEGEKRRGNGNRAYVFDLTGKGIDAKQFRNLPKMNLNGTVYFVLPQEGSPKDYLLMEETKATFAIKNKGQVFMLGPVNRLVGMTQQQITEETEKREAEIAKKLAQPANVQPAEPASIQAKPLK